MTTLYEHAADLLLQLPPEERLQLLRESRRREYPPAGLDELAELEGDFEAWEK